MRILILFIFFVCALQGVSQTVIVKTNPFNMLGGGPSLFGEVRLSRGMSLQAGYTPNFDFFSRSGFVFDKYRFFDFGLRYYPSAKAKLAGIYIHPSIARLTENDLAQRTFTMIGFGIGWHFISKGGFSLDLGAGFAYITDGPGKLGISPCVTIGYAFGVRPQVDSVED